MGDTWVRNHDDPVSASRFAIASLATWRLAHLLAEEDGPFDAVVRTRARLGNGQLGALMDCFYCLSIWVAVPVTLTVTRRRDAPLVVLGLSGAACLLQRLSDRPRHTAVDHQLNGAADVQLWTEAERVEAG
jgi:hypothetical protein